MKQFKSGLNARIGTTVLAAAFGLLTACGGKSKAETESSAKALEIQAETAIPDIKAASRRRPRVRRRRRP